MNENGSNIQSPHDRGSATDNQKMVFLDENGSSIHRSNDSSRKLASFSEKTNGLFEKVVRLALLLWALAIVTLVAITLPVAAAPVIWALRPLLDVASIIK